MQNRFRSLLLDRVDVRTPGIHVLKLALHRHLPGRESVEAHSHPWCQALLYLEGRGSQALARHRVRVEPGTLIVVPRGVPHAFARLEGRVPLCLAVDFRFPAARRPKVAVSSVTRSELAQLREGVARLSRMSEASSADLHCTGAAVVLQILTTLLRSAGWLARELPRESGRTGSGLHDLLSRIDPATPLAAVIRQSGYQRDYLNKLVRQETGITLGQYRAQRRLLLAKRLLEQQQRVSVVAAAVGLPDQNYFARWFRNQTGTPPSRWHLG
ncbi:MAG TPA: helix-turn-helix domain-containing protein [Opitutaceae bacterium]|jgi:AraC family L-rhamnose operon transcriptional activator RhaR